MDIDEVFSHDDADDVFANWLREIPKMHHTLFTKYIESRMLVLRENSFNWADFLRKYQKNSSTWDYDGICREQLCLGLDKEYLEWLRAWQLDREFQTVDVIHASTLARIFYPHYFSSSDEAAYDLVYDELPNVVARKSRRVRQPDGRLAWPAKAFDEYLMEYGF